MGFQNSVRIRQTRNMFDNNWFVCWYVWEYLLIIQVIFTHFPRSCHFHLLWAKHFQRAIYLAKQFVHFLCDVKSWDNIVYKWNNVYSLETNGIKDEENTTFSHGNSYFLHYHFITIISFEWIWTEIKLLCTYLSYSLFFWVHSNQ